MLQAIGRASWLNQLVWKTYLITLTRNVNRDPGNGFEKARVRRRSTAEMKQTLFIERISAGHCTEQSCVKARRPIKSIRPHRLPCTPPGKPENTSFPGLSGGPTTGRLPTIDRSATQLCVLRTSRRRRIRGGTGAANDRTLDLDKVGQASEQMADQRRIELPIAKKAQNQTIREDLRVPAISAIPPSASGHPRPETFKAGQAGRPFLSTNERPPCIQKNLNC